MTATITDTPLGIRCVFSDGSRAEFRVDELPCPELVHDLLTGLVESIHPHGTVDAAGSVRFYIVALRDMVNTLAGWGFTGGAADLTRAMLAQYWMAAKANREACTRRMSTDIGNSGWADSWPPGWWT